MIEIDIEKSVYLDCYHDILDCEDDVILLWGGRDSGKSVYIAQRLIEKCLSADRFKCILVKKSFESIKDSQWQTIKDIVYDWGLEDLFDFKVAPLEIVCKNGNRFIARGCDKPEKLKSIKDPTDAWYEEGNQLKVEDYTTISTTLRSNDVKVQEWFSFNPEHDGDLEKFWIYDLFFKGVKYDSLNFSHTKVVEFKVENATRSINLTYTSKHTTYRDNPYVSDQRIAKLEQLKTSNPYYYDVFTLGLWGNKAIVSPFATHYDKHKHESESAVYHPNMQVRFIFDFNLDPFAVNMAHMWRDENGLHAHIFDEMSMQSGSIPKLCDMIRVKYGHSLVGCLVTGDATSQKRDIGQRDNASHYIQIKRLLKLRDNQFRIVNNPTHQNSQQDVNYFLEHYPDFKINPLTCPDTCRDMKIVQVDAHGSILKKNRHDTSQLSDHLDCVRYFVNTFCKKWILDHQKYGPQP